MLTQAMKDSRQRCYNYHLSIYEKFQEIISPLSQVHVDWFAYSKLYLDEAQICKKLFRIDSNLKAFEWLCDNATDNGYDYARAIRQIKLDQDSFFITPRKTSDYIVSAFRNFGLVDALTIYKRHFDAIECWTFYSTQESSLLSSNVLDSERIDLLLKFKAYVNQRLADFDLHYQVGIDYPQGVDLSPCESPFNDTSRFMESLAPYHHPLQINGREAKITKREWECWRLVACGQSSKTIAEQLGGLSARTIDDYIQQLKYKTNHYNKTSLSKTFFTYFKEWI